MAQQQQQQQRGGPPAGLGGAGAGAGAGDLDRLRGAEGMGDLRALIQQNPAMIQPLVQQLAAQDPQLAAAVAANPELLLQLMAEGMPGMEVDDDEGGVGGLPPGATAIELTAEENAAVERVRLVQLRAKE